MVIFKYTLEITDKQVIECQIGAQFLTVQVQARKLQLWVLCNEDTLCESRTVYIFGTGNPISLKTYTSSKYLTTVQLDGFVWHIFIKNI